MVNVATGLAAVYIVIGLLLAAGMYHLMSGGLDDKFNKPPCECGDHGDEELRHQLDLLRVMRGSERGRIPVAVMTAIACLAIVLAWPVLVTWLIVQTERDRKARENNNG
jgi:hypothetical protein